MEFEWDENKNQANIAKHGVQFSEAAHLLKSGLVYETLSSYEGEERVLATGMIGERYVTVIYTMRGDVCRIISARVARHNERKNYEKR